MKAVFTVFICCVIALLVFFMKKDTHLTKGPVAIEGPVDNFVLVDHEGVFYELYNDTDRKAVVLVSQINGCPVNRDIAPYLNDLEAQYESKDVRFLMINAHLQNDAASMAKEANDYNFHIPVLNDKSQVISADLNMQYPGEALLINPEDWSIVYRGAVIEKVHSGTAEEKIQSHYLRDAIDALVEKKTLIVSRTQVRDCPLNMKMVYLKESVSFVDDVAPILIDRCRSCHNDQRDDIWAMNDYETIASYSSILREVIRTKRMPPRQGGESLSPDEIRTLVEWTEGGTPRGEGPDPLKN